jgi:mRNA interferase MazF
MVIKRFDVFLVNLDPTVGHEINRSRPCLIITPDEMNKYIDTVMVAPMMTRGRPYPSRLPCTFQGKSGEIVPDQIRTIDKSRLIKRLGRINPETQSAVLSVLNEMFAP